MYGLKTESSFDASHFLTDYHGKCENLHGHRWRVVAYLEVAELQTEGTCKDMVVDFGDFKGALRSLTERLDHHFIIEPREVVLRRSGRDGAARSPSGCVRDAEQLRLLSGGCVADLPQVAEEFGLQLVGERKDA